MASVSLLTFCQYSASLFYSQNPLLPAGLPMKIALELGWVERVFEGEAKMRLFSHQWFRYHRLGGPVGGWEPGEGCGGIPEPVLWGR